MNHSGGSWSHPEGGDVQPGKSGTTFAETKGRVRNRVLIARIFQRAISEHPQNILPTRKP